MIVGYARTSTTDQIGGLEAQLSELAHAGCERVFSEQASSVKKRPQLREAVSFVREGDTLVVTKLDRLARSDSPSLDPGRSMTHHPCKEQAAKLLLWHPGVSIGSMRPVNELSQPLAS